MAAERLPGDVHVFVYGTLRQALGHPMARLLQPATFVGEASVAGRLYELGRYPGMIAPRAPGDWVRGEVYTLLKPKLTLARLDEYEDCRPHAGSAEFVRKRLPVRLDNGRPVRAWVYRYNGTLARATLIPSGDYAHSRRRSRRWPQMADEHK